MLLYFDKGASPVRAKKELKFLQTLCNWARSRGDMKAPNPLVGILRQMKVKETRDIYVEDVWQDLVYRHAAQVVKDTMLLCYNCANRPAETTAARFDHIDGENLVVPLEKTRKKGLKEKRVLIAGKLAEYIAKQRQRKVRSHYLVSDGAGQQVDTNSSTFRRKFTKARDAAEAEAKEKGIPFQRFQLKDLRAKAATDIARRHGIEAARLMLGHTTQKQTSEYIRSVVGAAEKAFKIS
jgi:integrase